MLILKVLVFVTFFSASLSFADANDVIHVRDYLQRDVSLSEPAKRIVALAPHIVENIYSAGAGDRLVGVVDYCDYPEAAKKIPRVGAISAYSLESIVALKPDLVVVWMSTRGSDVLSQLESLGIKTYASDPHTLLDVAKSIQDYSKLAGTQAIGSVVSDQFSENVAKLKKQYQNVTEVSVLYQVWHEPLQTLNDQHIISDVIRLCGGSNSFGDAPTLAPKISMESVLARNPQAIVASGMGESRPEWLDEWKKWPSLQAVKKDNLYFIPPDIIQRHTVRMLQGAALLCDQLEQTRLRF